MEIIKEPKKGADNKTLYQCLRETKAITLEAIKGYDERIFSLFKMIHNQDNKIKELTDRIEKLERENI